MKSMMRLLGIGAIAALVSVPAALAQTPERNTLAIDTPVLAGNVILQPGVYTVRLLPTFADRTRVQIVSPDTKKIYATLLTVPHRVAPNEEYDRNNTFVFYPTAEGAPRALRTWYSNDAGALGGHDIVYDEGRARMLARLNKAPIVSYTATETADLDTTPLEVVTPEATVQPYTVTTVETAPAMTSSTTETTTTTTSTEPVQVAEAAPVETTPAMPQTASDVPLVALLGLMALGGAAAVRFTRQ